MHELATNKQIRQGGNIHHQGMTSVCYHSAFSSYQDITYSAHICMLLIAKRLTIAWTLEWYASVSVHSSTVSNNDPITLMISTNQDSLASF